MKATEYGHDEASEVWSVDVCCLMSDCWVLVVTSDKRGSVAEGLSVGRGKSVVAAGCAVLPGAASEADVCAAAADVRRLV